MGFKTIKNLLPIGGVLLLAAGSAFAGDFSIWNTGEGSNGMALANGTVDPHWTITATTDPGITAPASAYAISPYSSSLEQYAPNGSSYSWINPSGNSSTLYGAYNYAYTTSFTLPGAPNPYTSLAFNFAADDNVSIILNGITVDGPGWGNPGTADYVDLNEATNPAFQAGLNTITFLVNNNSGGQSGLQVDFVSEVYAPEPGSIALAGAGLLAFAAFFRKVRARS